MSRILRLFQFTPATPDFDDSIRRTLLPDLGTLPGLIEALAGRRDVAAEDDRLVASIWTTRDAMEAALGPSIEESPFHPELIGGSASRRFAAVPIVFGDRFRPDTAAQVLRLVEGTVREGEFDRYVEEAESGTRSDAAAGWGPVSLYLARTDRDGFVTLSAWTDWEFVHDATGADIHRPEATRHAERLVTWTATHYEVVHPEPQA